MDKKIAEAFRRELQVEIAGIDEQLRSFDKLKARREELQNTLASVDGILGQTAVLAAVAFPLLGTASLAKAAKEPSATGTAALIRPLFLAKRRELTVNEIKDCLEKQGHDLGPRPAERVRQAMDYRDEEYERVDRGKYMLRELMNGTSASAVNH